MSAEYSFAVDSSRDLLRIRMAGFFTREDIIGFAEGLRQAHGLLACPPDAHVTLNDLRDLKIQSRETVDMFREMLANPQHRSRRLALLVSPTLARSQAMRVLDGRTVRCFEDAARAEAWLLEPNAAAA